MDFNIIVFVSVFYTVIIIIFQRSYIRLTQNKDKVAQTTWSAH